MLCQNRILLKDSESSPCFCSKADFGLKAIRRGVSLHGATSKRDSMWHSPVFTCIRPNRKPVKIIKWKVVRNFEMQTDVPNHRFHRPLHLITFIMGHVFYELKSAYDNNKLLDLRNFNLKIGKWQCALEILTYLNIFSPNVVQYQKRQWIFLDTRHNLDVVNYNTGKFERSKCRWGFV
jgi:hypothetical protein